MKNKYKKEVFEILVKNSNSYKELCDKLNIVRTGNSNKTIKKYITLYNISISHFITKEQHLKSLHEKARIPLKEILIKNSMYTNNHNLKKRLIKSGLLKKECNYCGLGEMWKDKKLSLQLDHKNGIRNDNRIENLRLLCPNCHSQTETFSGKHTSKKRRLNIELQKQRDKNSGRTTKQVEHSFKQRKIKIRPSKEQLLKEIQELGYLGTGRKYGVSDNAIRKWLKLN